MKLKCPVCGDDFHFKIIDEKGIPLRCPFDAYREATYRLSEEMRYLNAAIDIPLGETKEELEILKKFVPDETFLTDIIKKTAIIKGTSRTFYCHFIRLLMFLSDVRIVASNQKPVGKQFNYLYMTANIIKDVFSFENNKTGKFKNITDLTNPSLLIYRLGDTDCMYLKNKGAMLQEIIQTRYSLGKATWIITSKPLEECDEIKTSENLRLLLSNGIFPTYLFEEDYDPEIYAKGELKTKKSLQKEDDDIVDRYM